ncbi:MAG TPA: hypothetical protein VND68_00905 [Chloroflexia bacterium]|jgi:hypothetical protein|nr:hypothetical protein [Chloroflexia bacterium]
MMFRRALRTLALGLVRALIVYGMTLSLYFFVTFVGAGVVWQTVLEAMHLLSGLYLVLCFVRFFLYTDEMQRHVQIEALNFAFGGTLLFGLTYGFLESFGLAGLRWFYLFPLMVVLWFAGMFIAERRYE